MPKLKRITCWDLCYYGYLPFSQTVFFGLFFFTFIHYFILPKEMKENFESL